MHTQEQLGIDISQNVDRHGLQDTLAIGRAIGGSVLAFASFSAESAVLAPDSYAQGVGPSSHLIETPAVASSKALQCEALALERPGKLTGSYQTYSVPNDNHYQIRFTLPSIKECDSLGKRKVTAFQQKQELGYGLHPKLEWTGNGLNTTLFTNQAKSVDVVLRAAHQCWPVPIGAYGNSDKTGHIKARPAVKETWIPKGGSPVSAIFSGAARLACK
jgi:hypothetical protein